jgi:hypothetical protein
MAVVSSIKHSRQLSPLSNIQGCCLLYSHECLIEETAAMNV